jgi:DNA-binding transcriptional ArsR family regulator
MAAKGGHQNDPDQLSADEKAKVMTAVIHPLRVQILEVLVRETDSPKGLSDRLDRSLSTVSYHVRILSSLEAVTLVKTEPRRGSVEHFYDGTRLGKWLLSLMDTRPNQDLTAD